jgi:hypothetical protein
MRASWDETFLLDEVRSALLTCETTPWLCDD